MAYFEPYIDDTGLHTPIYSDIRDDMISKMKEIFGNDIYIDEDSQDYQQISIFARKIFDTNSLAHLVYNNRTPITAVGVGLDNLCALVGIRRKPATKSTVRLTLTGTPGTVIQNAIASDGTYNWDIENTIIPSSGSIIVQGTCSLSGNIVALPNTITKIETPIFGWLSVVNNNSAIAGVDIESDAELRARFSLATKANSMSVFEALQASLLSIPGVERVVGYENDTNITDSRGFPAHSITLVVEGGDDEVIGNLIYYNKAPGVATNGTTVVDIITISGTEIPIRFYRPDSISARAKITLYPLSGYSEAYEDKIKDAIINYINTLQISSALYRSIIWSVATTQMGEITSPVYSVTDVQLAEGEGSFSQADIIADFNEIITITEDDIEIEVVS